MSNPINLHLSDLAALVSSAAIRESYPCNVMAEITCVGNNMPQMSLAHALQLSGQEHDFSYDFSYILYKPHSIFCLH